MDIREKIILRLQELLKDSDGFDEDYEDLLGFSMPTDDAAIAQLSDDQLIGLLEMYGQFTG